MAPVEGKNVCSMFLASCLAVISGSKLLVFSQLNHLPEQQFLYAIVTGDENWCLYINMKQGKEWLSPNEKATLQVKQDLYLRKTMMCLW